jgi:hypothetical protein
MSTIIETLQHDTAARIRADEFFAHIPVLAVDAGMVDSDQAVFMATLNQQSGKSGACVLVFMPSGVPTATGVSAPVMTLSLKVHVLESPEMNRASGGTGATAESIVMRIIQLLNAWMPEGATCMMSAGFEPTEQPDGIIGYACTFNIVAGAEPLPKCVIPVIEQQGQNIVLTGIDGESIYYTLDGSYPWPGNTTATLYTAPFGAPPVGTVIRWAAYATGKAGSDAGKAVYQ